MSTCAANRAAAFVLGPAVPEVTVMYWATISPTQATGSNDFFQSADASGAQQVIGLQNSSGTFYYYSVDPSSESKTPPGGLINAADVPTALAKAANMVGSSGYINTMVIGSAPGQTVQDFGASYPLSVTNWENLLLPVCGTSLNWTAIGIYVGMFVLVVALGLFFVYFVL